MKDSIRRKLERLAERLEEVSHLLADPGVIADTNKFRELSMEYSRLDPVVTRYRAYLELLSERTSAEEMAEGADNELRELGREELGSLNARLEREEEELAKLLLPKDARDDSNIYLEVRAGTGGDEAAIFAGDLFRMYSRYADEQGWGVEVLSESARRARRLQGRSSAASSARARSRTSSSSPARIACSVCPRPKRRDGFTRPL